jgi:hypothetical protein
VRRAALVAAAFLGALAAAPAAVAAAPPAPALPDLVTASDTGSSTVDNITHDSTPDFTVDAGSAQDGMTVTVKLKKDGVTAATGTAIVASGLATVSISSTVADGKYAVSATTTNGSSEESAASPILEVTIDTTAPTLPVAPILVITAGADGTLTAASRPSFIVFTSGGDLVEVVEGSTVIGSATAQAITTGGEADVLVASALADGSHTVFARATDPAGNVSAASPATTFTIDTTAPAVGTPDLVDDDGASTTDDQTSNPRPRFAVASDADARVTLYEDGVALGSAIAASGGTATISLNDIVWLDPGLHCVYAIAWDALANASSESAALCVTILAGTAPFTSNLGVALSGEYVTMSLRSSVSTRARVRVLVNGKVVARAARSVRRGKATRLGVKLPARARHGRVVVVATFRAADGRTRSVRRVARVR